MPWPPAALPPANRVNTTPMADNHPNDHDNAANALADIVTVLGAGPQAAHASVTVRLTPWVYTPPNEVRVELPTAAGIIKLRINAIDVAYVDAAGIHTLGMVTASGPISTTDTLHAGNTTVADLTSTGNQSFAGLTSMTGAQVATPAANDGVNFTRPSTGSGVGVNILSPSVIGNGAFGNRPLVIQQVGPAPSAGAGIGFHLPTVSQAGVFQFFANEFACNNANNSAFIPIRASAFPVASSIRFKHGVVSADRHEALEAVKELRPVSFLLHDDPMVRYGLIAEEVNEVLPEASHFDPDGSASAVDYGVVTAVLVSAVQELADQVRELRDAA